MPDEWTPPEKVNVFAYMQKQIDVLQSACDIAAHLLRTRTREIEKLQEQLERRNMRITLLKSKQEETE